MRRRLGEYRTGASNVCAEKLWRRLAKWAFAALILATIPTGAFASAAQECAASMARRDRLDHNGFKSRAKRYGLRAENVAYGCATEECARAKWWKSPGHARNMMLPGFKEVASARSRSGREILQGDVCFTPESGHRAARLSCPLSANSGHRLNYPITSSAEERAIRGSPCTNMSGRYGSALTPPP